MVCTCGKCAKCVNLTYDMLKVKPDGSSVYQCPHNRCGNWGTVTKSLTDQIRDQSKAKDETYTAKEHRDLFGVSLTSGVTVAHLIDSFKEAEPKKASDLGTNVKIVQHLVAKNLIKTSVGTTWMAAELKMQKAMKEAETK